MKKAVKDSNEDNKDIVVRQYTSMEDTRKYKHNYKLSKDDEIDMITNYYLDRHLTNIDRIASKYNVDRRTVYNIVNKYKKNNEKIIDSVVAKTRQNFNKKTTLIINKALARINQELDDGNKDIALSQLATLTGILYDKEALDMGKATSNSAFSVNIKIENADNKKDIV